MKNKKIIVGLILLLLLWGGNVSYFYQQQLSAPLFMTHYYSAYPNDVISLYYLVNRTEDIKVNGIYTLEGDYINFLNTRTVSEYSHHMLKEINIELKQEEVEKWPKTIKQLSIRLNNGEKVQQDIGEIKIITQDNNRGRVVLDELGSGSGNQGIGFRFYQTQTPLTFTTIDVPFDEILGDNLRLTLDRNQRRLEKLDHKKNPPEDPFNYTEYLYGMEGAPLSKDLFPVSLKDEEYIKLNHAFDFKDKTNLKSFSYYRMFVKFTMLDENHKEYTKYSEMHYTPFFTNKGILLYIKQRKED